MVWLRPWGEQLSLMLRNRSKFIISFDACLTYDVSLQILVQNSKASCKHIGENLQKKQISRHHWQSRQATLIVHHIFICHRLSCICRFILITYEKCVLIFWYGWVFIFFEFYKLSYSWCWKFPFMQRLRQIIDFCFKKMNNRPVI